MSLRTEFVLLASQPETNIRALCRRYGIAPDTAYKWLARYRLKGPPDLVERSHRPHHSPGGCRDERKATAKQRLIEVLSG